MSQRSRRGLATWLTSSRTPVFVLDERRVVLVFNQGCVELTQWTAADVIGKACHFHSVADPTHVDCITSALCPAETLTPGLHSHRKAVIHRPDGTIIDREVHYFPLESGEDHSHQHLLGIITPCKTSTQGIPELHFDIARHAAELFEKYSVNRLVARSPAMFKVAAQIELAQGQQASIHLVGERGTGKEHVARLIHYTSNDQLKRFVPIRCESASHFELNRTFLQLAESTAADDVGTVYLDQVSSLPGNLQSMLLDLMEIPDIRWMSSTKKNLDRLGEEEFLPELRTKLTLLTITMPPLRSRSEDLLLLSQQLLEEASSGPSAQSLEFSPAVQRLFQQHTWPGNIDELGRTIAQACARCSTSVIDVPDLPFEFSASLNSRSIRPALVSLTLDEELANFERTRISKALQASKGNKSEAAERLGIPRAKLYRRIAQLGLGEGQEDLEFDPSDS